MKLILSMNKYNNILIFTKKGLFWLYILCKIENVFEYYLSTILLEYLYSLIIVCIKFLIGIGTLITLKSLFQNIWFNRLSFFSVNLFLHKDKFQKKINLIIINEIWDLKLKHLEWINSKESCLLDIPRGLIFLISLNCSNKF